MSVSVRVQPRTYRRLRTIARRTRMSMGAVLDQLVSEYAADSGGPDADVE